MGFAPQLAERLRKAKWHSPHLLAEEIIAWAESKVAAVIDVPVTLVQQDNGTPPLTLVVGFDPDGNMGQAVQVSGGGGTIHPNTTNPGIPTDSTTRDGQNGQNGSDGQPGGPPPDPNHFITGRDGLSGRDGRAGVGLPGYFGLDGLDGLDGFFGDQPFPPPPPPPPDSGGAGVGVFGGALVGVVIAKVGDRTYRVQARRGNGTLVATVVARAANVRVDDVVPSGTEWPLVPATDSSGRVIGGVLCVSAFMEPADE